MAGSRVEKGEPKTVAQLPHLLTRRITKNGVFSDVLPVIDLQDHAVVRGVGGQRQLYRPIRSQLTPSANPGDVAKALHGFYGFRDIYVADLDAIAGAELDWPSYQAINSAGMRIWLDAGLCDRELARSLLTRVPHDWFQRIIIGLESLRDRRDLPPLVDVLGQERTVFSLDLRDGKPLTHIAPWRDWNPVDIMVDVAKAGIGSVIVLDLVAVGSRGGPSTSAVCRALRQAHPQLEIVSGGGVRNLDDTRSLLDAGCDRVMVASALHDGCLA